MTSSRRHQIIACIAWLTTVSWASHAIASNANQWHELHQTWTCFGWGKKIKTMTLSKKRLIIDKRGKRQTYNIQQRLFFTTAKKKGIVLFLKTKHTPKELHIYQLGQGQIGVLSPVVYFPHPSKQTPQQLARIAHPLWRHWGQACYSQRAIKAWKAYKKPLQKAHIVVLKKKFKNPFKNVCRLAPHPQNRRLCMREVCMLMCTHIINRHIHQWLVMRGIHPLKGTTELLKRWNK